jgi:glycosyltransferase involved in cell wall biosynthesis
MKILFIHNNYASNNSGEEHSADSLERLLLSYGHEVEWYRRFSDVINSSFPKKIAAFFLGIYNPKAIGEIKDILTNFKPDVVQVQNLYPFISPAIIKTIKKAGIPIVMRCPNYRLFCPTGLHMDGKGKVCERCLSFGRELNCVVKNCENNYPKSIGYALRNFFGRTVWGITKNMDAFIVQTEFQKQKFIDNGIPASKLFIVPGLTSVISGIEETMKSKYVSFIGRISEEKGIREFLGAARNLPNIPFAVVGRLQESDTHLKETSPSNILWTGFVTGEELDKCFKNSKIVVVPSKWYEGFPNVIIRAMKDGKPVITNNLGAMSAIIDHEENGLLVEPGNVDSLTQAISNLYGDTRKCDAYGIKAKEKADNKYSSFGVYCDLMELYYGLIRKNIRNEKSVISNGYKLMSESSVAICSIVRNCNTGLVKNIPAVEKLRNKFKESVVIVFENDSTDNTKSTLRNWSKTSTNVLITCEDFGERTIPKEDYYGFNRFFSFNRISKMANFRNKYLEVLRSFDHSYDYVIVIDLDIENFTIDGIAHSYGLASKWDVITANGYSYSPSLRRRYHDTYALVELGKESIDQNEKEIFNNQKKWSDLRVRNPLERVYSAFGGLAIYRYSTIINKNYAVIKNNDNRVEVKCEHFSLHQSIQKDGFDRIFINPSMEVLYQKITFAKIKFFLFDKFFKRIRVSGKA